MPRRKKHSRLPNGYGSIKRLSGKNRTNPYGVYPPTEKFDEDGNPVIDGSASEATNKIFFMVNRFPPFPAGGRLRRSRPCVCRTASFRVRRARGRREGPRPYR